MIERTRSRWLGCAPALVSALLLSVAIGAHGQEACGLAGVQYNRLHSDGFESYPDALSKSAASSAAVVSRGEPPRQLSDKDLGKPLSLAPRVVEGIVPSVAIVTPSDGASIPGRAFEVKGTFTGPVNTGISVNGSPALTFGNEWVSLPLKPSSGAFEIAVTATTMDGLTATDSHNVTVGSAVPDIEFLPKQAGNFAPADIGFRFRSVAGVVLGNVQVDFDGNGTDEYDGPASSIPQSFHYETAGLYTARAKTLIEGSLVTTQRTVLIADIVIQRERACAVYGALRTALAANDLEATLRTFVDYKREALRPFFNSLGNNRPILATRLGTLANGVVGIDSAALVALRIEEGEPIGYPVSFVTGADGVWRITSF